jgi:hypothetical protein
MPHATEMGKAVYSVINSAGNPVEVPVHITDYKAAADSGLSLSQYLNRKVTDHDASRGTPFEQMMASANMFIRGDAAAGIHPPTMKEVLEGNVQLNAGTIIRPDGTNNNTPSGRLIYPEVILQLIEAELQTDKSDFINGYNAMVAQTQSVTSPKVEQPVIDTSAPRDAEMANQPISQLAEPPAIVTITVSDTTRRIPTKAVGIQISDEALQATTLDLVGIAMTHQAQAERIRMVEGDINSMVNGDVDLGETALSSVQAKSFDSSIAAISTLSQKAWIHYLRQEYQKRTITDILCDVDTALAIEGRTGKPTINTDDPNSPRIDVLFSVENLGLTAPRVLLLDTALIGANTVVGLDRRYAIRRMINVNATYSAIEQYVMRRATGFRVDYGEMSHKLFTDAWSKMTLTVA